MQSLEAISLENFIKKFVNVKTQELCFEKHALRKPMGKFSKFQQHQKFFLREVHPQAKLVSGHKNSPVLRSDITAFD